METRQRSAKKQHVKTDSGVHGGDDADSTSPKTKEERTTTSEGKSTSSVPTIVIVAVILSYSIVLFLVWRYNYPSEKSAKSLDVDSALNQDTDEINELDYLTSLGWHLMKERELDGAKIVFEEIISKYGNDRIALTALGSIYNTQGKYDKTVELLSDLFDSGKDIEDVVSYVAFGEALLRVGRSDEAYEIHSKAAEKGLLKSAYQRPMEYIKNLRAQPWWTAEEADVMDFTKELENNWMTIRDEALHLVDIDGAFFTEKENLTKYGDWKELILFNEGRVIAPNCKRTPSTCDLLDQYQKLTNCKRCQIKYSLMQPGTHIWPHCGPSNSKLRIHLGLQIPEGAKIRVTDTTREWEDGKIFIFDDSYEHEVWQSGVTARLILIVDIWHPDITEQQKLELLPRRPVYNKN